MSWSYNQISMGFPINARLEILCEQNAAYSMVATIWKIQAYIRDNKRVLKKSSYHCILVSF